MVAVHTFIAEVLAYLIHTLEATDNKPLKIKFRSYPAIEVYVKSVMMGNERTRTCTARYRLQDWGLNLSVAGFVQDGPEGADDLGTLKESLLDSVIDHQINISLAITQVGIIELVVCHSVLVLDNRQRAK